METSTTVPRWLISLVSMHGVLVNVGYLFVVFKYLVPLAASISIYAKVIFYGWLLVSVPSALGMILFFGLAMTFAPKVKTTQVEKTQKIDGKIYYLMSELNIKILLDRSGSMAGTRWTESIAGINSYVQNLAKDHEGFEPMITVVAFDSTNPQEVIRDHVAIADWTDITNEVAPRGGTPLYSAASRLINSAMNDNVDDTVIIIVTDGGDTGGNGEYTREGVVQLIAAAEARNWQIVYIGADFNVVETATSFGLSADRTLSASAANMTGSFNLTANATRRYIVGGQSISYTEDEQDSVS